MIHSYIYASNFYLKKMLCLHTIAMWQSFCLVYHFATKIQVRFADILPFHYFAIRIITVATVASYIAIMFIIKYGST